MAFRKAVQEKEVAGPELMHMLFLHSLLTKCFQRSPVSVCVLSGAVLLAALATMPQCGAQASTTIRIDASQPYSEPSAANYDGGSAKSPSGSVLGVNSRYLTRDGKPWLPVMGEFHFSRYPRAQWEEELLKMKAAGVNIVASYVIWIHHEEIEGQYDWTGDRDLRAFAQLCAKHGMYLEPRIGPWAHAETRNGGLPDWLLKKGPTRSNDPVYLAEVSKFYGQIGKQLQGLMWKDGGPVIGIQLENEYARRGPGQGEEHILELKKIAIASGLDVPLYVVTGWDSAVVPKRAVIPVYGGGYPDAPWDGATTKLPPAEVYAFRFESRVAANMGAIGGAGANKMQAAAKDELPYLTAEIGGGIEDTYHRRPVIQPDDIGAMFPVMLGSGVNLYGTYMFQGGENPEGKLTTLEESQATGYPTDVPVKSYDFQAPLGEYGQERESLRKMKVFQYFLNDFGDELAPMMVHAPEVQPKNPADFSVPRVAVRSRGDAGFLFCNNYVRGYAMPGRAAAQFEVKLPGGVLQLPRKAVEIPSGAYFIWPLNLRMGGVTLRYSTAQLFTRTESAETLYFEAIKGIAVELAFDARGVDSVKSSSGTISSDAGVTYVSGVQPGVDSWIDVTGKDGKKLRLVVLTAREAENAWKVQLGGEDRLLITAQDFLADGDGLIRLRSIGMAQFAFSVLPAMDEAPKATLKLKQTASTAQAVSYAAEARTRNLTAQVQAVQAAGEAPAVKLGPAQSWRPQGVAQAPAEGEMPQAAKWSITLPQDAMDGLSELFLQVQYQGDVARLYSGKRLLTDDFFSGQTWTVGMQRYLNAGNGFQLSVLPLRQDAPVYFEIQHTLEFGVNGQVGKLDKVSLVPEYELVIGGQ
jgi:hypothetical protein